MHRHVTKHAEYIVPTSRRRGVNLKPPALAWAWLPENMTCIMYTWGQFSHMRPPPTSPAMQLHSTQGHKVIPLSAHQTGSLPTHAVRICCDYTACDFGDLHAMLQETCIEHQIELGTQEIYTASTSSICSTLL